MDQEQKAQITENLTDFASLLFSPVEAVLSKIEGESMASEEMIYATRILLETAKRQLGKVCGALESELGEIEILFDPGPQNKSPVVMDEIVGVRSGRLEGLKKTFKEIEERKRRENQSQVSMETVTKAEPELGAH